MNQPVIQRQELSDLTQLKANHGKKSKDILSGVFFCFVLSILSYTFIVKQADEIEQQAQLAAEYQAQFKEYPNDKND